MYPDLLKMFVEIAWCRKGYAHNLACNRVVVDLDKVRFKVIEFHRRAVEVSGDKMLALGQDQISPFPEIQAMEIFIHTGEVYKQI
jgi:hypothetical protein